MTKLFRAIVRGGDDIPLSDSEAEQISLFLLAQDNSRVIKIDETTLRIGDIRRVERDHAAEAELAIKTRQNVQTQLIQAKKTPTCHAEFSIQREINNRAKGEGQNWATLIRDKAWREQTRKELAASGRKWCDYKANTCYCKTARPAFV